MTFENVRSMTDDVVPKNLARDLWREKSRYHKQSYKYEEKINTTHLPALAYTHTSEIPMHVL